MNVKLNSSYPSLLTIGSLNSIFLAEEGYSDGMSVPVINQDERFLTVKLPSGRLLKITTKDIDK